MSLLFIKTRTKTSIRYAKENDREKRERVKGRGIEHSVQCVRPRRKSSGKLPNGEIKRKERLITKIMTRNYEEKSSASILYRGKMWEL